MSKIKRAVSLYSYQDEYARKRMSLEDIFDHLHSMGVEGVEIISDQMVKGTPYPNEAELQKWDKVLSKYPIKRVCNDVFANMTLYNNRVLRTKEAVKELEEDILLSKRLGFDLVRLVSMTPPEVVREALPFAEKQGVKMALEIHGGMSFDHPMTKAFTDLMFELNSDYLGLVVDSGIFCRRHPKVAKDYFLSLGLNPEIADYIDGIFQSGSDPKQAYKDGQPVELEEVVKSWTDREYIIFSDGYESSDYSIMKPYLPYIFHIHGKCYGFEDDGEEYSINFGELIKYLYDNGYEGYIATEYEGNRFVKIDEVPDGAGNVEKHQRLLKKYIDECESGQV